MQGPYDIIQLLRLRFKHLAEAKKAREKRVSIWARVKAVPVPDHRINSFCACYNNTFPETQGKSTFHRSNPLGGPSLDAERSLN
jgi:hypothetical protein